MIDQSPLAGMDKVGSVSVRFDIGSVAPGSRTDNNRNETEPDRTEEESRPDWPKPNLDPTDRSDRSGTEPIVVW